ncbi:rhamnulokinase family protein [Acidicapsa dinghuensis]|uniref:Rhamnulokinase family protein n=1 Tax=Acidicapsa dinghuensis TaxID=2218256 RepID=A0ABW1ERJ2_9BACT|nr:FGGY-family carbohydrate kinase [Acidicapsa dinghuensis]
MSNEATSFDKRAHVAIDLGAESCRVSLLQWRNEEPEVTMLHRVPNGPVEDIGHLYWPLNRILSGVEEGLRKAADAAPEGIASIGVDGWAVDYVRLSEDGKPVSAPFCYRDERTVSAKTEAETRVNAGEMFRRTGAQPLRINTAYQLIADLLAGNERETPWVLLPEYVLHWLGGRRVAEYTNATHTGLVNVESGDWCERTIELLGLSLAAVPEIVPSGSVVGKLSGALTSLPAFASTELIAPACHDTASAIASIDEPIEHTAYIVSGTWSLVGTVIEKPVCSTEAQQAGFTNQGAVSGGYCFHRNVNGMWMLKQCMEHWAAEGRVLDIAELIAQAGNVDPIPGLIDVDLPELLLAGNMSARINEALRLAGSNTIDDSAGHEPIFARVIFASLAHGYANTLRNLESLTGRTFEQIMILGGGSRNALLRKLTEKSTGLPVICGEVEGSTIGNFAVQLATREAQPGTPGFAGSVRRWAHRLGSHKEACA